MTSKNTDANDVARNDEPQGAEAGAESVEEGKAAMAAADDAVVDDDQK